MNIEYNGYNLEVIKEDSLLIGNCEDLGYRVETPNGYDRLVSRFQDTVDDYQKLQPYIEELDELSESNYSQLLLDSEKQFWFADYIDWVFVCLADNIVFECTKRNKKEVSILLTDSYLFPIEEDDEVRIKGRVLVSFDKNTRTHNAFLNGYSEEDEGLYEDE